MSYMTKTQEIGSLNADRQELLVNICSLIKKMHNINLNADPEIYKIWNDGKVTCEDNPNSNKNKKRTSVLYQGFKDFNLNMCVKESNTDKSYIIVQDTHASSLYNMIKKYSNLKERMESLEK